MTPNDQAFVDLCLELRRLGALSVECGDRKATFTAQLPKHLTEARITTGNGILPDDLDRFPPRPLGK